MRISISRIKLIEHFRKKYYQKNFLFIYTEIVIVAGHTFHTFTHTHSLLFFLVDQ